MVMSYRCISMLGCIIGLDGHFDDLDGIETKKSS